MQTHGVELKQGMKAITADGESLGKIVDLLDEEFVIEKGLFFVKDYYARYDDVEQVRDETAVLKLRKDQFEEVPNAGPTQVSRASTGQPSQGREAKLREGDVAIPVSEEEVWVETKPEQVGEVRIRKDVITEQKTVSVPTTREEVIVERVPVGEPVAPGEASFEGDEVTIPVMEEKAKLHKQAVVKEEVHVRKQAHEEHHNEQTAVKREEVKVDRGGAPNPPRKH